MSQKQFSCDDDPDVEYKDFNAEKPNIIKSVVETVLVPNHVFVPEQNIGLDTQTLCFSRVHNLGVLRHHGRLLQIRHSPENENVEVTGNSFSSDEDGHVIAYSPIDGEKLSTKLAGSIVLDDVVEMTFPETLEKYRFIRKFVHYAAYRVCGYLGFYDDIIFLDAHVNQKRAIHQLVKLFKVWTNKARHGWEIIKRMNNINLPKEQRQFMYPVCLKPDVRFAVAHPYYQSFHSDLIFFLLETLRIFRNARNELGDFFDLSPSEIETVQRRQSQRRYRLRHPNFIRELGQTT